MPEQNLAKLTTFKIGGSCENLFFPENQAEFVELLQTLKTPIIIGGGSNLLISSNGIKQPVISTSKLRTIEINDNKVKAECGVFGAFAAKTVAEKGLSGFEFQIAFPGTIGGNLYMNASAHGQFMSDTFISAKVFDKQTKKVITLTKADMNFAYKQSILQTKRYVLIEAEFELTQKSATEIKEKMGANLEHRKNTQPSMAFPNAGCAFKNPQNDSAGRLLDQAGMKGIKHNNVKVWESHANFIVNCGNATSTEVLELMLIMYNSVKEKYNIELEPEIIFIGEKNGREEEICNILYQKAQK